MPALMHLPESLAAWNSPEFEAVLRRELLCQGAGRLPVQQGLTASSIALGKGTAEAVVTIS